LFTSISPLGGTFFHTSPTYPLVSSDLDHVDTIFKSFDYNGDGFLNKSELMNLMAKLGHSGNSDKMQRLTNRIQTTVDGRLSFLEFYHAYSGTQLL